MIYALTVKHFILSDDTAKLSSSMQQMNRPPEVGDKAPNFSLPSTIGEKTSLSDFFGKNNIILAFYPADFSSVCTKEHCNFRDTLSSLQRYGTQVIGISVDTIFSHRAFAEKHNLAYPLLSDFNKEVTRMYGVLQDPWVAFGYRGLAKRAIFIIDKGGIIRYKWVTENPGQEPPYHEIELALSKIAV
jgi:peroxiredoxin